MLSETRAREYCCGSQFLAPGTHKRADAKVKATGQGESRDKIRAKGWGTEPASAVEDEAFAPCDLVLIALSRLAQSAFKVRKSGGQMSANWPRSSRRLHAVEGLLDKHPEWIPLHLRAAGCAHARRAGGIPGVQERIEHVCERINQRFGRPAISRCTGAPAGGAA